MEFVVNEWFTNYFLEIDKYDLLVKFITWFYHSEHKIIVVTDSDFDQKIRRCEKALIGKRDQKPLVLYKRFMALCYTNASKVIFVSNSILDKMTLTKLHQAGTNYASDQYLFEAAWCADSKIIVTTDIRLIEHMKNVEPFKLFSLEDFLEKFVS